MFDYLEPLVLALQEMNRGPRGSRLSRRSTSRWNAFSIVELRNLDDLFRSRPDRKDYLKLGDEISAALKEREKNYELVRTKAQGGA